MSLNMELNRPVHRAEGVTPSERYLKSLCDRSFLSLWSYPGVYRDQGRKGKGDGKELCDLLVVFGDHVFIFSDKHCAFPNSGDLNLDWSRWYRRAVLKSADQIFAAERWIRTEPKKLFLDRTCTEPFPIELPAPATTKFHRIVVAHGASRACKERFGGSGSLMLAPSIVGPMHYADPASVTPFSIGQVDATRGFVHVFDDTSLEILMTTLDTVADFTSYLSKKEKFHESGRLTHAAGEEDLLAFYLKYLNEQDEHDFVIPATVNGLVVGEGHWREFCAHPQRRAQLKENAISYAWDALIEKFSHHILSGTSYDKFDATVRERERAVRLLAAECRTARRALSKAILDLIEHSRSDHRSVRVMLPMRPNGPYYVFLLLSQPSFASNEREFREVRGKLLEALCMVVRANNPDAKDVVGLATEAGDATTRSEEVLYLDGRVWSDEHQAEAESLQHDLQLLTNLSGPVHFNEKEYPDLPPVVAKPNPTKPGKARSNRNSQCPCGSGQKFKRCCGRGR